MTETNNKEDQGSNPFDGAELIFQHTRKQAIEDGVLVDVSGMAREAGIRYPVAVTSRVWSEVILPSDQAKKEGQSETGRLWDLLWMLRTALQASRERREVIQYGVLVRDGAQPREVELKAVCGPGDDGEPVVTIMLPGED
jgi:hypothetical protein